MNRRFVATGVCLALCLAAAALGADVPRPAPELAVPVPGGQQVLLSQYRGKVVLIEFIQTTCPHCQDASVKIERVYHDLGPRGFQPLAVAINQNADMLIPEFVSQLGLTFPVGAGDRDEALAYMQHPIMKPFYVPQMVLVDRKGVIRAQFDGDANRDFFLDLEKNLRAQLEPLLKEPAPKASRPAVKRRPSAAKPAASAAR